MAAYIHSENRSQMSRETGWLRFYISSANTKEAVRVVAARAERSGFIIRDTFTSHAGLGNAEGVIPMPISGEFSI